ncbi:LOW QUALITY PROTEIN: hypothetical protein Cgig2_027656 [Carnegiea gigantea]|uniref:CCHC-type domain-containing protein n=1 Tax=Carnegiea gigantea TaxID=171969 RepID=A0A9Q1JLT4_9CARY|nr:LOW QUALITY PROTEIN: hypothetical protein Cgig2_027656 [Carnegiea gigantea]
MVLKYLNIPDTAPLNVGLLGVGRMISYGDTLQRNNPDLHFETRENPVWEAEGGGDVSEDDKAPEAEDPTCPTILLIAAEKRSRIRNVRRVDNTTANVEWGQFTRLSIEVDLTKPLLSRFRLKGRIWRVQYKGLRVICFKCRTQGHKEDACPLGQDAEKVDADTNAHCHDRTTKPEEENTYGSWMLKSSAETESDAIIGGDHGSIFRAQENLDLNIDLETVMEGEEVQGDKDNVFHSQEIPDVDGGNNYMNNTLSKENIPRSSSSQSRDSQGVPRAEPNLQRESQGSPIVVPYFQASTQLLHCALVTRGPTLGPALMALPRSIKPMQGCSKAPNVRGATRIFPTLYTNGGLRRGAISPSVPPDKNNIFRGHHPVGSNQSRMGVINRDEASANTHLDIKEFKTLESLCGTPKELAVVISYIWLRNIYECNIYKLWCYLKHTSVAIGQMRFVEGLAFKANTEWMLMGVIWVLWLEEAIQVRILEAHEQFIIVEIPLGMNRSWFFTAVSRDQNIHGSIVFRKKQGKALDWVGLCVTWSGDSNFTRVDLDT